MRALSCQQVVLRVKQIPVVVVVFTFFFGAFCVREQHFPVNTFSARAVSVYCSWPTVVQVLIEQRLPTALPISEAFYHFNTVGHSRSAVAPSRSGGQQVDFLSWDPKVHCRVH